MKNLDCSLKSLFWLSSPFELMSSTDLVPLGSQKYAGMWQTIWCITLVIVHQERFFSLSAYHSSAKPLYWFRSVSSGTLFWNIWRIFLNIQRLAKNFCFWGQSGKIENSLFSFSMLKKNLASLPALAAFPWKNDFWDNCVCGWTCVWHFAHILVILYHGHLFSIFHSGH